MTEPVKATKNQFVSRAGAKLALALDTFALNVKGNICADLGCSTGGFTDCLLQNGARKVYAVDTGYGVLDWKLRNDDRVVVMERQNALHVELPEPVDFISIDVGWTKQEKIIPKALSLLKSKGDIVTLVKPHYEAERSQLAAGRVRDEELPNVLAKVQSNLAAAGAVVKRTVESPVVGEKGGNREYLFWLQR